MMKQIFLALLLMATMAFAVPTVTVQPTFVDAVLGHKFNVTATAGNASDGTSNISSSIATSYATCTYSSNTSNATAYSPIYNCTGSFPAAAAFIRINFTDSADSGSVVTNNASHVAPNARPGAPTITAPINSSFPSVFVNCSATDPDGDALVYGATYTNNSWNTSTILFTGLPACNYTWNASNLSNLATYQLEINAKDAAALQNQSLSGTFTIISGSSTDFPYVIAGTIVVILAAAYTITRTGKKT